MDEPRVSAKGLAEFVTAGPSRKRSILRNFKFPSQGEGIGRTIYYQPAIAAIRAYHRWNNEPGILADAIQALDLKGRGLKGLKKARIENNIRAIQVYSRKFGDRRFKVLKNPRLGFGRGSVTLTASADLYVQQNGEKLLIKLDLGKKRPKALMVRILLHIIHEAAVAAKLGLKRRQIIYLDTVNGEEHMCPPESSTLSRTVDSACDEVAQLWKTLA